MYFILPDPVFNTFRRGHRIMVSGAEFVFREDAIRRRLRVFPMQTEDFSRYRQVFHRGTLAPA